nr:MAG TPA: hypothetical protein [Caudoviricetes sp.]
MGSNPITHPIRTNPRICLIRGFFLVLSGFVGVLSLIL